ncbi:MAG: glycine betaine ABC transporter substrate-binding protein [Bacteroidales bacterium]
MRTTLFLFLSCFVLLSCQEKNKDIRIATKPMTEQFILGEMLSLLIEEYTDLQPRITKGIGGGTSNIHPALLKGDFDFYPEYTGTAWQVVLKKDSLLPAKEMLAEVEELYRDSFALDWVGIYGFNNTYGLAVSKPVAKTYALKKISDLAQYPDQFSFGAEYDFFEIHKGYDALCKEYNLKFKKTTDMDIGLKYEAMKAGKIDVLNVFTTDGQLANANLNVLEDDKNFFPSYYCGTVIREETLKNHPELKPVLMKMNGILNDSIMVQLNYEVDMQGKSERRVAADFLKSKNLLPKNKTYGD